MVARFGLRIILAQEELHLVLVFHYTITGSTIPKEYRTESPVNMIKNTISKRAKTISLIKMKMMKK